MTTNNSENKPHISFIGLGNMGNLMVERLLQAGYQMTVYDRTKEKTQNAVHLGANISDHPQALAATCDNEDYSVMLQFMEQLSGLPTSK